METIRKVCLLLILMFTINLTSGQHYDFLPEEKNIDYYIGENLVWYSKAKVEFFEIQYSVDNENFSTVDTVFYQGLDVIYEYRFMLTGYYRIRYNGKYSKVVTNKISY